MYATRRRKKGYSAEPTDPEKPKIKRKFTSKLGTSDHSTTFLNETDPSKSYDKSKAFRMGNKVIVEEDDPKRIKQGFTHRFVGETTDIKVKRPLVHTIDAEFDAPEKIERPERSEREKKLIAKKLAKPTETVAPQPLPKKAKAPQKGRRVQYTYGGERKGRPTTIRRMGR